MQTIRVRNDAELRDAIRQSSDGGTIELADGSYSGSSFSQAGKDYSDSSPLRFVGINEAAVINGSVAIHDSSHIEFENVTFQTQEVIYSGTNALPQHWQIGRNTAVNIANSESIDISNSNFLGYEITQDYYIRGTFNNERFGLGIVTDPQKTAENGIEKGVGGIGLTIRSSGDVNLIGNTFESLYDGINFLNVALSLGQTASDRSDGTVIKANHFSGLQQDAIRGTDHSNTLITQNLFENFEPISHFTNEPRAEPKTHPDAIQYWEDNAAYGVTDLTISENLFYQEDGPLQVIFGHQRGQRAATDTAEISDFTIKDNLIYTGGVHGISLGSVIGTNGSESEITGNTILWNGSASVPQIRLSGWETTSSASSSDLTEAGYTNHIDISGNLLESRLVVRGFEADPTAALSALNAEVSRNGGSQQELTEAHRFVANLYNAIKTGQLDLANLSISAPEKPTSTAAAVPQTPPPEPTPAPEPTDPPNTDAASTIEGTSGRDKLIGTAGHDLIFGGDGGDRILAGAGNDTIDAGTGNDWFVKGGTGSDTFVFNEGDGSLKIVDWEAGVDKMQLTGVLDFANARLNDIEHAGRTTASLIFDTDGDGRMDHRVLIADTSIQDLSASDFL